MSLFFGLRSILDRQPLWARGHRKTPVALNTYKLPTDFSPALSRVAESRVLKRWRNKTVCDYPKDYSQEQLVENGLTMSYIGTASDVEQEKNLTEFRRNRSNASLVYKATDNRDDTDSEISDSGNFLAKGEPKIEFNQLPVFMK